MKQQKANLKESEGGKDENERKCNQKNQNESKEKPGRQNMKGNEGLECQYMRNESLKDKIKGRAGLKTENARK